MGENIWVAAFSFIFILHIKNDQKRERGKKLCEQKAQFSAEASNCTHYQHTTHT